MACYSGPRIKMPSISACPPMLVRKAQDLFSSAMKFPFCNPIISGFFSKVKHLFYFHCFGPGRQMVTTVPPPSALPMEKVPPWKPTISSHTARPMPLPRALEVPL